MHRQQRMWVGTVETGLEMNIGTTDSKQLWLLLVKTDSGRPYECVMSYGCVPFVSLVLAINISLYVAGHGIMTWNLSWRRADRPHAIGFARVINKKGINNKKKAFNPSMTIAYWINNKNNDKLFGAARRTYRDCVGLQHAFCARGSPTSSPDSHPGSP